MNRAERFIGYTVIAVVIFLGINQANAWQFAGGESFEGDRICKLLSVDEHNQVVFGLINGQVTFASVRPLWAIKHVRNGDPVQDIENGFGIRVAGKFYQGTIYHDPRQSNEHASVQQMFMGPYDEEFNDLFMAQDKVKIKAGFGRQPLNRTYNMEGARAMYGEYKDCMGW